MSEQQKRCEEIISTLQSKETFKKINGEKIRLFIKNFEKKYKDFHAQAILIPRLYRYIVINQDRLNDDPEDIAAIIAHELGHHEHYYNLGTIEYLRRMFKLIFRKKESSATRREMESYADMKAIEAGCAHGLYNHRVKHPKTGSRKEEEKFYMSPEEIEAYAKSIDKW